MCMLTRRLQILLDEERYARLEAEAARRGVAVAVIVREAIDAAHPSRSDERVAAGERVLAAAPMPVPDPDELRDELQTLRGRRG